MNRLLVPFLLTMLVVEPGITLEPESLSPPEAAAYTWALLAAAHEPGMSPVAAARCDRDADGNPELVVAYAGNGRGALVWIPAVADSLGAAEDARPFGFEPSGLVAGDLDADGEPELALSLEGEPALMVLEIERSGKVMAIARHDLPGVARRIALEDLPRRDGLPDLLVDLDLGGSSHRLEAASARGALHGLAQARLEPRAEQAPPAEEPAAERTLLCTRVDRDAIPEVVVADGRGGLWLGTKARSLITVDTTADVVDFGGTQQVGDLPGADGLVSLREAIIAANNTAGAHTVEFNIVEAGNDFHDGCWWFTPSDGNLGPLPVIAASVTIDGYTQTENRGDTNPDGPELVLDGSGLSGGNGLDVQGADCAVIDLVIQGFPDNGVAAFGAANLVVKGCFLGTDQVGTAAAGNYFDGIELGGATTGAMIGGTGSHGTSPQVDDGNLISGNGNGVVINGAGTDGNSVLGNLIGTDRDGSATVPNANVGVDVYESASTTIGGTAAGAGNLISGNTAAGININGVSCDDNLIQGNLIGTTADGLAALANHIGGRILGGSQRTTVGGTVSTARNLISGNEYQGIQVQGAATADTLVKGNWIGLDISGAAALGNGMEGVWLSHLTAANTIGGSDPGAGNVISGNTSSGVVADQDVVGCSVVGNLIGTDSTGTAAVPNGWAGVVLQGGSSGNTIGGPGPGEGNVISGNLGGGVTIWEAGTDANSVVGNLIGLDQSGEACLDNDGHGIWVVDSLSGTEIDGNWIGCNSSGISLGSSVTGTVIRGNAIGVSVSGTVVLGNDLGVELTNDAGTTIGGPGEGNEIASSTGAGIVVRDSAVNATISRNSIHDNGGLGIDLGNDGVTANDPGDTDEGPNHLVNFPVLTSAVTQCGSGATTVVGTVDTPSPETGAIELFGSPSADPTGHGEGETFLGAALPAFNGTFTTQVPEQAVGSVITATFTDAAGSTSELSHHVVVQTTPLAPSALQAVAADGPAVDLQWTDNASDETSFRIERRQAGTPSFSLLDTVAADATAYTDPGPLVAGTAYYYRVRAGSACLSAWSNVASAIVPGGAGSDFCTTRLTTHRNAVNAYLEHGDGFFGMVWRETEGGSSAIAYARLDAAGAIIDGPVVVTPWGDKSRAPQLVWSGDEWGLLWYERLGDEFGLFFERLDPAGNVQGPVVEAFQSPELEVPYYDGNRGLAWAGVGWGVVWNEWSPVDWRRRCHFAHLDATGEVDVGPTLISDSPEDAYGPMLAFNGTDWGVAWFDNRDGPWQLRFRRVGVDGSAAGPSVAAATGGTGFHADLRWSGDELGLAWADGRDGDLAVYFRRLDVDGAPLSAETRISDPFIPDTFEVDSNNTVLRWSGDRWAVAVDDTRTGDDNAEIRLSFADAGGNKLGSDVLVSTADGFLSGNPALAWDGATLLAAWRDTLGADSAEIHAQAMDESGDPGANPRQVLTSGHVPGLGPVHRPNMAFTGSGQAVAWADFRAGRALGDVLLILVDGNGAPLTGEIQVADSYPADAFLPGGPAVAFSGEVIAVLWGNLDLELYLSRFNAAGAKLGPDLLVDSPCPWMGSLAWTGDAFIAAYTKNVGDWEVFTSAVAADGTVVSGPHRISDAAGASYYPTIAGDGAALAVAWCDDRDGNQELYAAALDRLGARVGSEIRVTDEPAFQTRPYLGYNGEDFLLVWHDGRDGGQVQVYSVRLGQDAAPLGVETRLSDEYGFGPGCIWGDGSWGVVFCGPEGPWFAEVDADGAEIGSDRLVMLADREDDRSSISFDGERFVLGCSIPDGEVLLKSIPCGLDDTPPTCPTSLTGVSTPGAVELSWTPGTDDDFAVDWQLISRDDARIAVMDPVATSFTDPLLPDGTYSYRVTTLNQGAEQAPGCPSVNVVVSSSIFADGFETGDTTMWSASVP